ncbi:MAG: Ppx/GppA phosphatase family [Acidimicrobiales bacterium]|nr:Ppx/GppA phosphatase family [Acidimicrobiales bacterium]
MTRLDVVVGDTMTTLTITDGTATARSAESWDNFVIPCGVVDLGQRHIVSNPPLPEELTNAIGEMMDHVDDAKRELPGVLDATEVFIAGAVPRVMAAVEVGRAIDADAFVLDRDAAEDVFRTLATESTADRRHNPGLPADLVDTVVGGCCVVIGLIRGLQLDAVTVMMKQLS